MKINETRGSNERGEAVAQRSNNGNKSSLPFLVVLTVATIGILITMVMFAKERTNLKVTLSRRFDNMATAQMSAFEHKLNSYSQELDAVRRFYRGSVLVDRNEFEMFTKPICDHQSEISAMIWAPRLPKAKREQHRAEAEREGVKDYRIREMNLTGQIVTAGPRDHYFPAYYVEPLKSNQVLVGLDFATIPAVLAAMQLAVNEAKPTITETVVLPKGEQEDVVFVEVIPVYSHNLSNTDSEQRFENLRGFVIGVISIEGMMDDVLKVFDLSQFGVSLRDSSSPNDSCLLHQSNCPEHLSAFQNDASDQLTALLLGPPLSFEERISVGGREWVFRVVARPDFYSVSGIYTPWYVMATGFFITVLLSMFVHGLQAHTSRVESLVEIRTRELASSEGRLRAITEGSPAYILMIDRDGSVGYANRLLGHQENCQTNRPDVKDLIAKKQRDLLASSLESVFQHGQTIEIELALESATDGTAHFLCSLSLLNLEDEPDHVLMIATDITDRKTAEQKLKKAQSYIANIIDSMPSSLIGVDREGTITQWNMESKRVTGVSAEQAIGHPLVEIIPRLASEIDKVKEAMRSRQTLASTKLARKCKDETRYEDVTVYPLLANGVDGAVIRIDDVTDRVRIEEMMIQTEKMLSVGGLAAGMAHEINNPLGGMMQAAQNIERRLSPDLPANTRVAEDCGTSLETIHSYLEQREILTFLDGIRECGARAAEIVKNMLQFSRKSDTELVHVDLAEIIDRAVDLAGQDYNLKKQYDFRRIEVVREYSKELPAVPVIQTEIEQVLLNLLRNGAQAMSDNPKDKPAKFILRTGIEGSMARIDVEDNGTGITDAIRNRIFEPFFTTKEVGTGTGLGLSVSYMIIKQNHEGEMKVDSLPGVGTTFTILLPLEQSSS